MTFSTIFLLLLYATIIYLHIKQSPLILLHDIKVARTLAFVLLILIAINHVTLFPLPPELVLVKTVIHSIATWLLMILIYWRLLAGCYKDAFFKKNNTPDQTLRKNVKYVILDAAEKNQPTPDFELFLKTHFEDPGLETIRIECEKMACYSEPFSEKQLAKLKELVGRLG